MTNPARGQPCTRANIDLTKKKVAEGRVRAHLYRPASELSLLRLSTAYTIEQAKLADVTGDDR